MNAFTGTEDTFDSREAIERIAELEEVGTDTNSEGTEFDADRLCDEFREEYDALIELRDESDGYVSDWPYGKTFIHEGYFTAYCMEMLSEVGYLPADLPSWVVINEDATADNMKEDYDAFEFMGSTYYAR
jgi:hypothetical protein